MNKSEVASRDGRLPSTQNDLEPVQGNATTGPRTGSIRKFEPELSETDLKAAADVMNL